MEPNKELQKLLKVKFSSNDTFYEIKRKLIILEDLILHTEDLKVCQGAFDKMFLHFKNEDVAVKSACISHFKKVKNFVTEIDKEWILRLLNLTCAEGTIKYCLKFVKIFSRFFCDDYCTIFKILFVKHRSKYGVLLKLIEKNDKLLGLFAYNLILHNHTNMGDSVYVDGPKRLKLNNTTTNNTYFKKYIKKIEKLKALYFEKHKSNPIEILKLGDTNKLDTQAMFNKLFVEEGHEKEGERGCKVSDTIAFNFKTQEEFLTNVRSLLDGSKDYNDSIIYQYFIDKVNQKNKTNDKFVFEVKNGKLDASFLISVHNLTNTKLFKELEKSFILNFRK